MNSEWNQADLETKTIPGRFDLYVTKYWHVLRSLLFVVAGLLLAYWLLTFGGGVMGVFVAGIFIGRAFFGVKDSFMRIKAIDEHLRTPDLDNEAAMKKSRAANVLMTIGDVIIIGSIGLTALTILGANPHDGVSGVPMAIGVGLGFLFYLVGVPVRIAGI